MSKLPAIVKAGRKETVPRHLYQGNCAKVTVLLTCSGQSWKLGVVVGGEGWPEQPVEFRGLSSLPDP